MDPNDPTVQAILEIFQQINELSGGALDVLLGDQGGGEAGAGAPPTPPEGAPAPEQG